MLSASYATNAVLYKLPDTAVNDVAPITLIGDCLAPRNVMTATAEGHAAGHGAAEANRVQIYIGTLHQNNILIYRYNSFSVS